MLLLLQMGKYNCKCIAPGCHHVFLVEADTLEEAVQKVIFLGNEHNFKNHPDMPILSDEKLKTLVSKRIQKV